MAVPQDCDAVGHAKDLAQLVRDVHDAHPPVGQRSDQVQQPVDLGLAEGRRRLIHDHDSRLKGQGPGDLDQLLLGYRQVSNLGPGIQIDLEQLGDLSGTLVHGLPVEA